MSVIGEAQLFGDEDIMLKRPYSSSLRCIQNDSEAFMMPGEEFLRLSKMSDEASRIMHASVKEKE